MLAELLAWTFTPASLDARRTGHLAASVSLWSRVGRCRGAWKSHEEHCHAIVARAVEGLRSHRVCIVLGSGLMRDVPLSLLAERFDEVRLIDVVHLWPARLAARRLGNVRLIETDLTGSTDLLLGRATGFSDPFARLVQDPDVDLVVSANCLSQLALLPAETIERKGGLPRMRYPDIGRRIVQAHLHGLARFSCRVCLLSDTEGFDVDASGREIDRYDLLHGVTLPPADDDWDWLLAPIGEFAPDHSVHHAAHGWVDWAAAVARARTTR